MDRLGEAAEARPDAPALITVERTVSYRELDLAAWGVASIVVASGSLGRHPVAYWAEPTLEAIAATWGFARSGVTAVPVDPRRPPAQGMEMTRSAGARGLWSDPDGGFDALVARGRGTTSDLGRPEPSPRFVVFTSGSEGARKGVLLTAENIDASVAASQERIENQSDDTWLLVLPLFHVGGLSILWRQATASAPVAIQPRFEAGQVADALDDVRLASLVPVMLRRVLAHDDRTWSGLHRVLVGGAAVATDLLEEARRRGLPVVPTYGMTETCSQLATGRIQDQLDGAVGSPVSGADVRTVDDAGSPIDTEGRIEVRGPMVSPGYLDEPRESEWFRTGDIGEIGSDGRVTIRGRADRVIVTGGENVHPSEVERVIEGHPAVAAAKVHGIPDVEWGQRVVADVEFEGDLAELDEWVSARLVPAMRPREWRLVDQLATKLGP